MNLTQNDRLKQVTSDTLIVGVDVGSQTHFCRAFDWRGFELSRKVFKFSNTGMGFLTFLRWTEELMNKTEMKKVIVGCEPTGCYWLTFQKFLQDHDVQLVTVVPFFCPVISTTFQVYCSPVLIDTFVPTDAKSSNIVG